VSAKAARGAREVAATSKVATSEKTTLKALHFDARCAVVDAVNM
jgi:hypothetical protein